jgi:hypothetical protein
VMLWLCSGQILGIDAFSFSWHINVAEGCAGRLCYQVDM